MVFNGGLCRCNITLVFCRRVGSDRHADGIILFGLLVLGGDGERPLAPVRCGKAGNRRAVRCRNRNLVVFGGQGSRTVRQDNGDRCAVDCSFFVVYGNCCNARVSGEPLRVNSGVCGYRAAVKIIRCIQAAVAVPVFKGVSRFGRVCRLYCSAARNDDLRGNRTAVVGFKSNGIKSQAAAFRFVAVRIIPGAFGFDLNGVAVRFGDIFKSIFCVVVHGNRVAMQLAVLVKLNGVAGRICNRIPPCRRLTGGGAVPSQILRSR